MPWQIGLFNNIATSFPCGNPSHQHLSIIWEKITAPGRLFFSHKKTELRFRSCDKKSRCGSKIHNHICGSIIAASRCHISICPESGKEWSKLSRGSHSIGRMNIDQPADTGCSWDFEAPWLCSWHLSQPECCPCAQSLWGCSWTEMQSSHLSSPLLPYLCPVNSPQSATLHQNGYSVLTGQKSVHAKN